MDTEHLAAGSEYTYHGTTHSHTHQYLAPAIEKAFRDFNIRPSTVFELGCGNGSTANWLQQRGFAVTGVDPSTSGIKNAQSASPLSRLCVGSCYDPLSRIFGKFPLVISLEVIEHVYAPREFVATVKDLLPPGGRAMISTPYHGYIKNLALALSGRMDAHFTALWDHGHIKFWSRPTISRLLSDGGLHVEKIYRVGRIAPLAKSMLVVARRTDD